MPIQTIPISETTIKSLEQLVPESKRLDFIDNAIIEALQQISIERTIDTLENSQISAPTGKNIVETLRDIRQEESERLIIKQ